MTVAQLAQQLQESFAPHIQNVQVAYGEVTVEINPDDILAISQRLRDENHFRFEQLIDLCGVDYLHYGCSEWETTVATTKGFERGVHPISQSHPGSQWKKPRIAVVYHLLSVTHNRRVRLKAFVPDNTLMIDSVVGIWNNANWYEREAFDLYGILFKGHPDLRRILTDYGFIGHPFRKDFPLVGNVEVRYDATQKRVIYEPVDIVPRTLVPKVIRQAVQSDASIESEHGSN